MNQTNTESIVMTGVTAGFGLEALRLVVQNAVQPIFVGARDISKMPPDIAARVNMMSLDLSQLSSVHAFCDAVGRHGPVGTLILNAGISARRLRMTDDGFNQTFQVNYLAHFAILQQLWDLLTDHAHIVITSSGTHDPAEKTPPPPPRHAVANWLAKPLTDPKLDRFEGRAAARAYTSSKLCCTMLSLELATRRPQGTSISFDPGLVPGTELTREFPKWLVKAVLPIMSKTMPADRTSTLPASANSFAQLMAQKSLVGRNGDYVAMRGGYPIVVQPSLMARDTSLRQQLWSDSEALLASA